MNAFVDQVYGADAFTASRAIARSDDIDLLKSFSLVPGADVPVLYDRLDELAGRSVKARKAKDWMISTFFEMSQRTSTQAPIYRRG